MKCQVMVTAAAVALVAVPALAGNASAVSDAGATHAAVVGEVVDTRNVTIRGPVGDEHKLYKLRTADGNSVVVDVGRIEAGTPAPDLKEGDLAMAIGSKARINGQPVLFARYYGEGHAGGSGAEETSTPSANPGGSR